MKEIEKDSDKSGLDTLFLLVFELADCDAPPKNS